MTNDIQDGLNQVLHENGKSLIYRFTPALICEGSPLLIIFSAWGTKIPSRFSNQKWNVLSLIDTHGIDGNSCGYLGERGDWFVHEMVEYIISKAIEKCKCVCRENLFMYSSSIASIGAIRYSITFEAKAIFLNAPIIQTNNITMTKVSRKENFDFPYDPKNRDVIESDMVQFMKAYSDKYLPTFFVVDSLYQNEDWLENFLEEHTLRFVNACKEEGATVYLELKETTGHIIHYNMKDIVLKFETYTPPKYLLDIFNTSIVLNNHELKVVVSLGRDYPFSNDVEYAFYLLYQGETKEKRPYQKNSDIKFSLEDDWDISSIKVRIYIKHKNGHILADNIAISV